MKPSHIFHIFLICPKISIKNLISPRIFFTANGILYIDGGFLDLPGSLSVLPTLTQVAPGLAHLLHLPGGQLGDGDGGVADWLLLSLQAGADPNLQDMGGYTALMWSKLLNHRRISKLLIDHGAL